MKTTFGKTPAGSPGERHIRICRIDHTGRYDLVATVKAGKIREALEFYFENSLKAEGCHGYLRVGNHMSCYSSDNMVREYVATDIPSLETRSLQL